MKRWIIGFFGLTFIVLACAATPTSVQRIFGAFDSNGNFLGVVTSGSSPVIPLSPTTFQGVAFPNTNNGATETIKPQSTTGLNAIAENFVLDTVFNSSFAPLGALYNDPAVFIGYNNAYQLSQLTPDPFNTYLGLEGEYEYFGGLSGQSGTATGGTILTLIDTGQTWAVNQWARWVAYNTVTTCRGLIASNTSNTLTITSPVLADGLTACTAANANGQAYQIFTRQQEDYLEIGQNLSGGGFRLIRPFQVTADKATMWAQGLLGNNGAVTITAATSASPASFSTGSVNHGLVTGEYVKFANLAGGTWGSSLNNIQYQVTVTGATTFTINVNATGFGTYTASSGTETAEPTINSMTFKIPSSGVGTLNFDMPSWSPTGTDTIATLGNGNFTLFGNSGGLSGAVSSIVINPQSAGGQPQIVGSSNNVTQFQIQGNNVSTAFDIVTFQGGANNHITLSLYRPNSTDVAMTLGSDGYGYVQGLMNVNNQNQTSSRSLVNLRGATSQSGDYLDIWDSATGNTTKLLKIDSNLNLSAPSYISIGTTFTLGTGTGACATTSTLVGGATTGSFLCTGTAGASTQVINLPTAPNGWECSASDVTSGVVWAEIIPIATNSAKISGTITTTSDRVVFNCSGF